MSTNQQMTFISIKFHVIIFKPAGSSPTGTVGRDLNLQKLNYQCLTTRVAVVLVSRWYFNG